MRFPGEGVFSGNGGPLAVQLRLTAVAAGVSAGHAPTSWRTTCVFAHNFSIERALVAKAAKAKGVSGHFGLTGVC